MIIFLYSWNEWIVFPYKYSELSRDTMIVFKIHDAYFPGKERIVGSTSISIFGKYGALRRDLYDLIVFHNIDDFESKIITGKINKSEICYKLNKVRINFKNKFIKIDEINFLLFTVEKKVS